MRSRESVLGFGPGERSRSQWEFREVRSLRCPLARFANIDVILFVFSASARVVTLILEVDRSASGFSPVVKRGGE